MTYINPPPPWPDPMPSMDRIRLISSREAADVLLERVTQVEQNQKRWAEIENIQSAETLELKLRVSRLEERLAMIPASVLRAEDV